MTLRPVHGASLGVAGALVAGLVLVPSTGSGAADTDGPSFHRLAVTAVPSDIRSAADGHAVARGTARRVTTKASSAKKPQILQVVSGIAHTGSTGVSTAAGPKQVVQTVDGTLRVFTKSTGAKAKKGNKSASAFFHPGANTTVSQPTVIYDPVGKRFIAVAITDKSGDVGLAMRISKGSAAAPLTNKKWLPSMSFATSGSEPAATGDVVEWNPKVGVSGNKIAITTVASDPDDASTANRIFILPKGAYYKGNNPGVWASEVNSTYDGQAPAVNVTKQANAFIAVPDTDDVSVTTYTGKAKNNPPAFSKNVVYPTSSMAAPGVIGQVGGDNLDLGGLEFTGVSWRSNTLYAAATVDNGGQAAIRVFGVSTASGVTLRSDALRTPGNVATDWFDPDLAIDKGGNVVVTANEQGTAASGLSTVVLVRKKSNGSWTKTRRIAKGNDPVNLSGNPVDWWNSTAAALDPTSPWDVWVAGSLGQDASSLARVSLAKNKATIKASDTRVKKGKTVTFTAKLVRPDSKDTIKGLPIALQKSPKSHNSFSTIKSGKTSAKGKHQWTVKVKKAAKYRTLGKQVKPTGGAGVAVNKVTSTPVTISLR